MPPKEPTPKRTADAAPPIKSEGGGGGSNDTTAGASHAADPASSTPHVPVPAPRGRITAKPRAGVRRTQAVRAEEQREIAAQKAKEAAERAKKEVRRGRGGVLDVGRRGGRGRGGFMGERDRMGTMASGPFSAGRASSGASYKRQGGTSGGGGTYLGGGGGGIGGGGSGGGGGGGGSSSASRSATRGGGSGIKQEDGGNAYIEISRPTVIDGGYVSSEDDEEKAKGYARKNVDEMGVIDLTGEDLPEDPTEYFQPIRASRREYKERKLGLIADGAASAEAISQEIANESGAANTERKKGKQRAKDIEYVGEREKFQSTYSSSDTETEVKVKAEPGDNDGQLPIAIAEPAKATREMTRTRTRSDHRPPPPAFQTAEEIEEWKIQQRELETIQDELGSVSVSNDADGDAVMSNAEASAKQKNRREDHVYLFQFPPVIPDLQPIQVKADPDGPAANDRMDVDGETSADAGDAATKDGGEADTRPKLASGAVGKLKIHRSGKATLDWGGLNFKLGLGSDIAFLQQVYVMTMPEGKEGEEEKVTLGQAVNMGRVRGKFVVSPDWDEL